jgi:hypothetical protein
MFGLEPDASFLVRAAIDAAFMPRQRDVSPMGNDMLRAE